jgi:hypothetical protein
MASWERFVRICEKDDVIIDYDKNRKMYRVSIFEDNHWKDEYWFNAYEEKELDSFFPQTIGNITYYSKAELFEWIETQQKLNQRYIDMYLKIK